MRIFSKHNFFPLGLSFLGFFLSFMGCKVVTPVVNPNEVPSQNLLPYTAAFKTLQSVLESAESGTSYIAGAFSGNVRKCQTSYDCTSPSSPFMQTSYEGCDLGAGLILNGLVKMTFSSSAACLAHLSKSPMPTGTILNRTISAFKRTEGELSVEVAPKGPSSAAVTGSGFSISLNQVKRTHSSGEIFTVESPIGQSILVSGSLAKGSRVVRQGSVLVGDFLNQEKFNLSLSGLRWGNMGCCYPSSGTVAAEISNDVGESFSELLTFSGDTCGAVSFESRDGLSQKFLLDSACE